jgi:hypothetical protein
MKQAPEQRMTRSFPDHSARA